MSSALFTPSRIGSLELRNRIIVSPMCQYSADEGRATDWHVIHLGHLALSGAALLFVEATAVEPAGRISSGDLGLWSDDTEAALARTLETVRRWSDIPIAIQLAHAGRKASTRVPWEGSTQDSTACVRRLADGRPIAARIRPDPTTRRCARFARACGASAMHSPPPRRVRGASDLRRSKYTTRTAISCTSSCRRSRTLGLTSTAAASRTGCGFRSRCSKRFAPRSRPIDP
jgi:2,4-dienoyl-CoA reductase-like NADH-dependent reductase (Old Yellow Enzyme family)